MFEIPKTCREFKIGDLVINLFPIEMAFDEFKIEDGAVGLIVGIIEPDMDPTGYNYVVLIKGREIFFFEKELALYRKKGESI